MSAPQFVGPGFGNSWLEHFNEIIMPAPVGYLPQTWGWWALVLLMLGWALSEVVNQWRRWRGRAYRRRALALLKQIEQRWGLGLLEPSELRQLPRLLRWVALHSWSRERVATSSGKHWWALLDQSLSKATDSQDQYGGFSQRWGPLLECLAFAPEAQFAAVIADAEVAAQLLAAISHWIRFHQAEEALDADL